MLYYYVWKRKNLVTRTEQHELFRTFSFYIPISRSRSCPLHAEKQLLTDLLSMQVQVKISLRLKVAAVLKRRALHYTLNFLNALEVVDSKLLEKKMQKI